MKQKEKQEKAGVKSILKKKNILENNSADVSEDEQNQKMEFKLASKKITKQIDDKLKRQYLDKAKNRMGKQEFDKMIKKEQRKEKKQKGDDYLSQDDSSSNESEDEFGNLDTDKAQFKFIETLAKLKGKSKDIYDEKVKFFNDDDFEEEEEGEENKKDKKKFSYKEMVQRDIEDQMENSENSDSDSGSDSDAKQLKKLKKNNTETPHEEQIRIKNEFKAQSKLLNDSDDDEDEEENEGGLFQVKQKSQAQIDEEEQSYKKLQTKLDKKNKKDQQLVDLMWGDKQKLDDKDQFLRKYILTKGWIDKEDYAEAQYDSQLEDEMEEEEEKTEIFEHKYDFRYEEPNGAQLVTYERTIEDSARQSKSARAEKRKQKREEKQNQKVQMEEDVKRLKNIKKQEIVDRLKKIQQIGGIKDEKIIENEDFEQFLEKEFDGEEYDKMMKKNFGKKYRKEDDIDGEELVKYAEELEEEADDIYEKDLEIEDKKKEEKKGKNSDKDVTQPKINIPIAQKKNLSKDDVEAIRKIEKQNGEEEDEEEEYNMICWYCDNCERGLQPGELRFDCQNCPDYVLCQTCNNAKIHEHHVLKRFVIPQNCAPPQEEILKSIISKFKICKKCDTKLNEYTDMYVLKSNTQYVLCDECFDKEKYQQQQSYEHVKATKVDVQQLIEKNDLSSVQEKFTDEVLDKLVNEYYTLDFEDVIAGGIKTKFKYQQVAPESYGLSDENILFSDPKLLNNYISLKKLAPYREDEGKVKSKIMKNKVKLNAIEKSTKLVKYQIRKENEQMQTIQEKIKKLKKSKKPEKKIEKLQAKLEKIKQRKIKPLSTDFFKKLGKKEEEGESDDDDELSGDEKKNKKNRVFLTNLSQPMEITNVSSDRLKTYGINKSK